MSSLELEKLHGNGPDPQTLAAAFAAYIACGGNSAEACRVLAAQDIDVKPDTLRYWRDRYPNRLKDIERKHGPEMEALGVDRARRAFVQAGDVMLEAIAKARTDLPHIPTNRPETAAQIAVSMAKVLQTTGGQILSFTGRPTSVVEHRDVAEIIQSLKNKGIDPARVLGSVEGTADEA